MNKYYFWFKEVLIYTFPVIVTLAVLGLSISIGLFIMK